MAELTKPPYTPPTITGTFPPPRLPSPASTLWPSNDQINELRAGEALAAGDACYIKNDGKIWRSTGVAVGAAAVVDGYAVEPRQTGDPATIVAGVVFHYANTLAPGAAVYLSAATPGGLADTATTGGTVPIGRVLDANRILLIRSY